MNEVYHPERSLTDRGYRYCVCFGIYPKAIKCPDCGGTATFRDDALAARYECLDCGHVVAAMYADPVVVGEVTCTIRTDDSTQGGNHVRSSELRR